MKERWKHFEHTRAWNDIVIATWQKMMEQLWNFPGRDRIKVLQNLTNFSEVVCSIPIPNSEIFSVVSSSAAKQLDITLTNSSVGFVFVDWLVADIGHLSSYFKGRSSRRQVYQGNISRWLSTPWQVQMYRYCWTKKLCNGGAQVWRRTTLEKGQMYNVWLQGKQFYKVVGLFSKFSLVITLER